MAERASVSEIAERRKNSYNPDRYIKAAETYIKPGYTDSVPFSRALEQLKVGLDEAESIGKATSDVYEKFRKEAESLKGRIPEKGNYKVISENYESFINRCVHKRGKFPGEKHVTKSSSLRP